MNRLDKRRIARSFNAAAPAYEQHAVLQKTVSARLLERLDLITIKPQQILDAGAGVGSAARHLARRYRRANVLQVDLAQGMLQTSRKKTWKLFSRHHYLCADVEALPVKSASVDLVFSSLTYQWCENPDAVFAEAARVLRTNGLLLFATLGPDTLKELRASWQAADNGAHVGVFYDMHDIGDALVRTGLEGVVMDTETITLEYPDCKTLMQDIKVIGAHNASTHRSRGLTGRSKIQKMETAYESFRRDGRLPATYEIVYGHAWATSGMKTRAGTTGVTYIPVEQLRRQK